MSSAPVTRHLAEAAVRARQEPLSSAAVEAARSVILDWCGVTVGGSAAPPARALRDALVHGGGTCQLVGVADTAEPMTAALVNGTAAHTLELDDIYAPGLYHPGAPTVAAALAAAQASDATGARLLRSVVIGFEVGNRIARALGAGHYRYWHTTGTAGSIAAAAAVAEVRELGADAFAHALGLAATMAAGLQQTFRSDSMGKPLHSGHAAQVGVTAGLSAAAGFTGPPDALDGEIGMGAVMSDGATWDTALGAFGREYSVEQTTVKPYPCCGHAFAAIDAALSLREQGVRPPEVEELRVQTYSAGISVAGIAEPSTDFEAKFSIPFVVACALRDGRLGADAFAEAGAVGADVGAVMRATTLEATAEFDTPFPARRGARVSALLTSGERVAATVPDRRGAPVNPLSPDQLDEKFLGLAGEVLGQTGAQRLRDQVRSLEERAGVRELYLA